MRRPLLLLFLSGTLAQGAPANRGIDSKELQPPPYVVRVLALGHEPERKFKGVEGGLFVMLPPEPDEIPPAQIFFRPPSPPAPLPANSPLAKQYERIRCEISLNSIQQSVVPVEVPRDANLVIEKEIPPPISAAGSLKGVPEKAYEELGKLERKSESSSALVVLYNPAGSKVWNKVKANIIDTSESTLPVGSILVYNLCRENLSATVGSPTAGVLTAGQSALVRPVTNGAGNFALRLLLNRGGEIIQLIDGERSFPPGSRAFLIIYPVPITRNAREADFILFVIPPDPKPEPVVAPVITPKPVR